jgi:hypothetical protein
MRVDADVLLPSFLIIGPPRTGSSWMHEVLSTRANLPSPTKETRFFDCHFARGLEWYRHHFRDANPELPCGEVAPTYFYSREARERIAETLPDVKIVCTFRHPVERMFSLYRLKRAYGMLRCSLEEALEKDPELLESGKYATHLSGWLQLFPREQLLVTIYDELRRNPQGYMDSVCTFLAIPRIVLSESDGRHVHSSERIGDARNYLLSRTALAVADWCKARKLDRVVARVRESESMPVFTPEVEKLEHMLGRDLSAWKLSAALQ